MSNHHSSSGAQGVGINSSDNTNFNSENYLVENIKKNSIPSLNNPLYNINSYINSLQNSATHNTNNVNSNGNNMVAINEMIAT